MTTTESVSPVSSVAVPVIVGGVTFVGPAATVGAVGAEVSMTIALFKSSELVACDAGRVVERLLP